MPSYPPPQLEGGFRNNGWRAERDADGWRSDAQTWRSEPSDDAGWREPGGVEAPPGDDAQERARREWLQYYLEVGDFQKASELVASMQATVARIEAKQRRRDWEDCWERVASEVASSTAPTSEYSNPEGYWSSVRMKRNVSGSDEAPTRWTRAARGSLAAACSG